MSDDGGPDDFGDEGMELFLDGGNDDDEIELCRQLLEHAKHLTGAEVEDLWEGISGLGISPQRLVDIQQNHASELP